MKTEQSIPKRWHIKFRRRRITQKKTYNKRKNFISRIVPADETWVDQFESETKRQSMEWHRLPLPGRRNSKPSVSGQGLMGLWRVIFVEAPRGETIKSDAYNRRLTDSGIVSSEFSLTGIQEKSWFSATVQGRTRVWRLGKLSQNLAEEC